MIIPQNAIIAEEKIRDYLLVTLEKNDKSGFLHLAGYNRADYWELLLDIRTQLLPAEAEFQGDRGHGPLYEHRGILKGPNGISLGVKLVWIVNLSGEIHFVTLIPDTEYYKNEIRTL